MVYILYSSIKEFDHKRLIDSFLPGFCLGYQKKIMNYRRWQDAQLSLLGRVLLIKGMKALNYKFNESHMKYTKYNKPYLSESDIKFNISHSGDVVICALTLLGDIGIDIEKIAPIKITDFKSHMTTNEWQLMCDSNNVEDSFFNFWTQKEAVIKAHGKGLSIPLKSFEIQNNKTMIARENFFLKEIKIKDGYKCHLALKKHETIKINIEYF